MEDAPQTVGTAFVCGNNVLTTLQGAPKTVNGSFNCSGNPIPQDIIVKYQGMSLFVIIGDEDE